MTFYFLFKHIIVFKLSNTIREKFESSNCFRINIIFHLGNISSFETNIIFLNLIQYETRTPNPRKNDKLIKTQKLLPAKKRAKTEKN